MTRMTHKPHIFILTEHFSPSTGATAQLVHDIATGLISRGLLVTVITSTPSACKADTVGLSVVRLVTSSSSSINILSKLSSGLLFSIKAFLWLLLNLKPANRLLIVSNPPFIAGLGPLLLYTRSIHYYFLLQDLFPLSAELTGVLPSKGPISSFWRRLIRFSCLYSSRVVLLSEGMKSRAIQEYGLQASSIQVIHNWSVVKPNYSQKSSNPLIKEWDLANKFIVQYSGNFGRLHDLLTLLEAARLLSHHPIQFVFIGGGSKLQQIQAYCKFFKLSNISLYPYQPRESLSLSLSAADISAVTLIPGSEDVVAPSKYYGIIASARPVLLISNQTTPFAREIIENNIGLVVSPGDSSTLARNLIELSCDQNYLSRLSENSYNYYISNYGATKSIDKYYDLLCS